MGTQRENILFEGQVWNSSFCWRIMMWKREDLHEGTAAGLNVVCVQL